MKIFFLKREWQISLCTHPEKALMFTKGQKLETSLLSNSFFFSFLMISNKDQGDATYVQKRSRNKKENIKLTKDMYPLDSQLYLDKELTEKKKKKKYIYI